MNTVFKVNGIPEVPLVKLSDETQKAGEEDKNFEK
jgi:hypothetical protein